MSSLIIAGDTSGTVALQAPAVAGTTILTLPSVSGTIVTTTGGNATSATNISDGIAGNIPYQSSPGVTAFVTNGTNGQLLSSNGSSPPTWTTVTVPPAAAQGFVTQFTGGNTPPTMQSSGFGLI